MTLSQAPGYDEDGETIGMTTNSDVSSHPPLNLTKKRPPTSESDKKAPTHLRIWPEALTHLRIWQKSSHPPQNLTKKLPPTSESDKKASTHLWIWKEALTHLWITQEALTHLRIWQESSDKKALTHLLETESSKSQASVWPFVQVKTYKSVEEVKGKLPQDSLRRNGSGKKVSIHDFLPKKIAQFSYPWLYRKPQIECVLSKVDGTRGASVTSPGDESSSKNGAKLRRGSSAKSGGCNDLILKN